MFFPFFRSMNGSLPRPDLHLPLPNSETDPDSWSCSRSRDTSPESSIPPGMPSFRVIPLTCESDVGVPCGPDPHESPYVMRGSEPPDWETEPLQNRAGSVQPSSTMLRKNQYWVSIFWMETRKDIFGAKICIARKVHIFWEGHRILRNLHRRFDWHYIRQIYGGNFAKFCGLLRIYEL